MPKKRDGKFQINDIEANILIVIQDAKKTYGYDIIKLIEEKTDKHITLRVGKLYPILHRLEECGYLSSSWGDENETYGTGGARRKYYQVTAQGKKAITDFLSTYIQKNQILIKASATYHPLPT